MICRVKGYQLKVVLAANVSVERRQLLESWGAEIIDSPGSEGSNGAVRRAQALAAEHPEWGFLYQYANPANPKAHYEGTGPEIWRDCPEVTHFVAGLGTSGTLLGVGRFLKEQNPDVKVLAIEPPAGEMVDGLRNLDDGYIPPIFIDNGGADLLDGKRIVRPRESIEWTRRLTEVGIFAGISSGAALAGAVKLAADHRFGHHRGGVGRRGLEVPLHRGVDRRPRCGRRAGQVDHLLLIRVDLRAAPTRAEVSDRLTPDPDLTPGHAADHPGLLLTVLGCDGSWTGPGGAGSGYLVSSGGTRLVIDLGPVPSPICSTISIPPPSMRSSCPTTTLITGPISTPSTPTPASCSAGGASRSSPPPAWPNGPASTAPRASNGARRPAARPCSMGGLRLTFSRTDHSFETLAVRVEGADRSLGYSADTGPGWTLGELGSGLDLVLCEATYTRDHEGTAGHLSARQAGEQARAAGAGRLVITHRWPTIEAQAVATEAAATFGRPVEQAAIGKEFVL